MAVPMDGFWACFGVWVDWGWGLEEIVDFGVGGLDWGALGQVGGGFEVEADLDCTA